jgi:hypothetical protein
LLAEKNILLKKNVCESFSIVNPFKERQHNITKMGVRRRRGTGNASATPKRKKEDTTQLKRLRRSLQALQMHFLKHVPKEQI